MEVGRVGLGAGKVEGVGVGVGGEVEGWGSREQQKGEQVPRINRAACVRPDQRGRIAEQPSGLISYLFLQILERT